MNQVATFSSNTFTCTKGAFISTFFLCDGINDCNEILQLTAGSDDQGCESNIYYKPCKKDCSTSISVCSPLHYKSAHGKCVMYLSQDLNNYFTNHSNLSETNSVKSYIIPYYKNNPLFKSTLIRNNYSYTKCQMLGQLPCSLHPTCHNISDICLCRLGHSNNLYPCPYGLYIQQCREFECHQHYKCPEYYCIPWAYVCDGKWDCPHGYDKSKEHNCGTNRLCINQFKCRYSQICIHIHDVCNKIYDCSLHDDEVLCQLKGILCPKLCKCLNFALMCNDEVSSEFITLYDSPYVAYHLVSVSINSISFLKYNNFVMGLNVSKNSIFDACEMGSHRKLHFVHLSWNNIRKLSRNCFNNMKNLQLIILKRNMISYVEAKSFHNLNNVFMIDLSSNNLSNLLKDTFVNISIINIIKLNKNSLTQLHMRIMFGLTVQTVYSSNFYICCTLSTKTKCLAPKPWYVSCSDLLPSPAIKIVFIIISLSVIVANLIPLWMKYKVL